MLETNVSQQVVANAAKPVAFRGIPFSTVRQAAAMALAVVIVGCSAEVADESYQDATTQRGKTAPANSLTFKEVAPGKLPEFEVTTTALPIAAKGSSPQFFELNSEDTSVAPPRFIDPPLKVAQSSPTEKSQVEVLNFQPQSFSELQTQVTYGGRLPAIVVNEPSSEEESSAVLAASVYNTQQNAVQEASPEPEVAASLSESSAAFRVPNTFTGLDLSNTIWNISDGRVPFIKLDPTYGYEQVTAWLLAAAKYLPVSQQYTILDVRTLLNNQILYIATFPHLQAATYDSFFPLAVEDGLEYFEYYDSQGRLCNRLADKHVEIRIGPTQSAPVTPVTFSLSLQAQQRIATLLGQGQDVYLAVGSGVPSGYGIQFVAERDAFSGSIPAGAVLDSLPPAYAITLSDTSKFTTITSSKSLALGFQGLGPGPYSVGSNVETLLQQSLMPGASETVYSASNSSATFLTIKKVQFSLDLQQWNDLAGPMIVSPNSMPSAASIDASVLHEEGMPQRSFFRTVFKN